MRESLIELAGALAVVLLVEAVQRVRDARSIPSTPTAGPPRTDFQLSAGVIFTGHAAWSPLGVLT